jgi:hypothetical protein
VIKIQCKYCNEFVSAAAAARHRRNFRELGMCQRPDIFSELEDSGGDFVKLVRKRNPIRPEDKISKEDTSEWT